jgi:hypothetical protein
VIDAWDPRATVFDRLNHVALQANREGLESLNRRVLKSLEMAPERASLFCAEAVFAVQWTDTGRVVYDLTHSLAALFALTTGPALGPLPHEAFLIKVPRTFLPIPDAPPLESSWICVSQAHDRTLIVLIADAHNYAAGGMLVGTSETDPTTYEALMAGNPATQLMARFALNVVAYVTQHRATAPAPARAAPPRPPGRPEIITLSPPPEVVVTRTFRDAARAAVTASNLIGVRRAMAHVVRGHWRNLAVGPGRVERRLTWIQPFTRGDASLGRVVSRIEALTAQG